VKTLGIIGGTGPESTIDYYRSLIAAYRARTPDGSYPSIFINSVDNQMLLTLVGQNRLAEIAQYLVREIAKLGRAGADFGLLAANTSHIVFDILARESAIPLLSIVEATREVAERRGLERVGLFGTRFTMQADFLSQGLCESRNHRGYSRRARSGLHPREVRERTDQWDFSAGDACWFAGDCRAVAGEDRD